MKIIKGSNPLPVLCGLVDKVFTFKQGDSPTVAWDGMTIRGKHWSAVRVGANNSFDPEFNAYAPIPWISNGDFAHITGHKESGHIPSVIVNGMFFIIYHSVCDTPPCFGYVSAIRITLFPLITEDGIEVPLDENNTITFGGETWTRIIIEIYGLTQYYQNDPFIDDIVFKTKVSSTSPWVIHKEVPVIKRVVGTGNYYQGVLPTCEPFICPSEIYVPSVYGSQSVTCGIDRLLSTIDPNVLSKAISGGLQTLPDEEVTGIIIKETSEPI